MSGRPTALPEQAQDGLERRGDHGIDRGRRIDDDEAIGLGGREREEPATYPTVIGHVEGRLEASLLIVLLARESDLDGDVEQHREIRPAAASRESLEFAELVEWQAEPITLVGERGVCIPRAQDELAASHGRIDDLGDVLCPRGGEEERVRAGRERRLVRLVLQQDRPNALTHGRSAGFAGQPRDDPAGGECIAHERGHDRLAAAVGPLNGDEPTRRTDGSLSLIHASSVPARSMPGEPETPGGPGARPSATLTSR